MLRVCLLAVLVALSGTDSLAWSQSRLPPPSLRELAEIGDPEAAFNYGYELTFPVVGEPDTVTGRYWLIQASDTGFAPANAVLGILYRDGFGVDPDIDRARSYFELAWQAGDVFAGLDLADLILFDYGGERATALAILESLLDDEEVGPMASLALAETLLFDGGSDAENERAITLARDALSRQPGLHRAHYMIGIGAAEGFAGPVDRAAARRAWEAGAETGDSLAMMALAESWLDTVWGRTDPVEAHALYSLAADIGEADAAEAAETLADTLDDDARAAADLRRQDWADRLGWTEVEN